jgi:serine/threonine protein phosphatase PrpC
MKKIKIRLKSKWEMSKTFARGKKKKLCQDRVFGLKKNNVSIIALADGAGSCKYSHIGARLITRKICDLLTAEFDIIYDLSNEEAKQNIISDIIFHLKKLSKQLGIDSIKELSSTLLFVAVKQNKMISGHIGDGVSGVLKNNELLTLTKPENGEFSNITFFTTSDHLTNHFRLHKRDISHENIKGFVLMSDGTAFAMYDKINDVFSEALFNMFMWLDYHSGKDINKVLARIFKYKITRKTEDDCSLIMMKKIRQSKGEI